MPRNIEIKARIPGIEYGEKIAQSIGARFVGVLRQTDTYFEVVRGRLKLRQIHGDHDELIFYKRDESSSIRASAYEVFACSDAPGLKALLTGALGQIAEVKKTRLLYMFQEVRIHLDSVDGLGEFLEVEAPVLISPEQSRSKVHTLIDHFSIRDGDFLDGSYLDLKCGIRGDGSPPR